MADKLDWLNKHFILLRRRTLQETIELEKYKMRPDLEPLAEGVTDSEEFLRRLRDAGKYKEACDFLAYAMHRRAAIWWGYRCLLTLVEELNINPATERDIADIGAPKPMDLPDWAKEPSPEETAATIAGEEELSRPEIEKIIRDLESTVAEAQKLIPPEVQRVWDQAYGAVNDAFRKEHGISLEELVKKAAEKSAEQLVVFDPNSPIFKAAEELQKTVEAKRQETVELIKSVIPPKVPAHELKVRDSAMSAIYRWVIAPDEGNSQTALDAGNACPDQPAGLMAMAAFWSFGNLTPTSDNLVPTPAGLAANGICSSLLQAALHKGGTRKYMERCELYLNIGLGVVWGEDNWAETITEKEAPHEQIQATSSTVPEVAVGKYSKWNPSKPVCD